MTSIIPQKRCTKCGVEKLATPENFNKSGKHKDGLRTWCKTCCLESNTKARRTRGITPKEVCYQDGQKRCKRCGEWKPYTAEYFHRDNTRKSGLFCYCKECNKAHVKIHRVENPEIETNWRNKNREYIRRKNKEYYPKRLISIEKNRPKIREQSRLASQRHKTRLRQLPTQFDKYDWQRALDYFHGCCAVCGRQLNDLLRTHKAAMDHWIPLSNPKCPGTIPTNIVPLCHGVDGCNNSKNDSDAYEWLVLKFGKRKAMQTLKRINAYFEWAKSQ